MIDLVKRVAALELLAVALSVAGLVMTLSLDDGCVPVEAKQAVAGDAYKHQQEECVTENVTKAEIDTCREAVDLMWGITTTRTDAGASAPKDAGSDR